MNIEDMDSEKLWELQDRVNREVDRRAIAATISQAEYFRIKREKDAAEARKRELARLFPVEAKPIRSSRSNVYDIPIVVKKWYQFWK